MSAPKRPDAVKQIDDVEARAMFSGDAAGPVSLGQYWQQYRNKLRAGDVGSLPALLGLLVLIVVFTIAAPDTFLSTFNFANLLTQAGSICVLAMGIGFVLLLGHIDLSAGVIGGVGAGVMAMLMLKAGLPWYLAVICALAVGVVMGIFTGMLVSAVGIPSFVVTLATFLAYQGVLLWIIGTGGTVAITDETIIAISNGNMPVRARLDRGDRRDRRVRRDQPAGLPSPASVRTGHATAGGDRAADRGHRGAVAWSPPTCSARTEPSATSCWRAFRGSPRSSGCCW